MNDFVPVSWNGEAVSTDKLNQMANNDQYLFDRAPRMRYTAGNLTRDTSLKMISGKTPYPANGNSWVQWVNIYFGSFFTAGCHPVVTATIEVPGNKKMMHVVVFGFNNQEIDHTGFIAAAWNQEWPGAASFLDASGYVHWQAVGY